MFWTFLLGFICGIVAIIGGLLYALMTLQRNIRQRAKALQAEDQLVSSAGPDASAGGVAAKRHALSTRRQLLAQLTKLDPVKVISKVKFCCADAGGVGVPRYGRVVIVGTTLTLYETILTHKQSGIVRPYLPLDTEDDPDLAACSSCDDQDVQGGGGGGHSKTHKQSQASARSQYVPLVAPSGYTLSERLVGKINVASLSAAREERRSKSFAYDVITGNNLLHLVRLSFEEELLAAAPDSDAPTSSSAQGGGSSSSTAVPFVALPKALGGVGWGSGAKGADASVVKEAREQFFMGLIKKMVRFSEGKTPSVTCEAKDSSSSGHKRVLSNESDCPGAVISSETHTLQKAIRPPLFIPNSTRPETKKGLQSLHGRDVLTASYLEENPCQWRSLLIRFPNARETERWAGVLSPSTHSYQWRRFVKSLPSVDVLNVFVARIFFENREEAELQRILTKKINRKLSEVDLPKTLEGSKIRVHSVSPGPELPLISNVSALSYNSSGELGFDFDLWYRGGFILQLTLDLKFMNKTDLPALVVTIGVKEVKGRLHVSVSPPPANKMWLGFHEPPDVSLDFRQELAEASKSPLLQLVLKLIPDLSVLITDLVKVELFEDMTLPNLDDFPLPNVEDTPPTTPRGSGDNTNTNNDILASGGGGGSHSPSSSSVLAAVNSKGSKDSSTRLTFKSTETMSLPPPLTTTTTNTAVAPSGSTESPQCIMGTAAVGSTSKDGGGTTSLKGKHNDPSEAPSSTSTSNQQHQTGGSSSFTATTSNKARLVPRGDLHSRNKSSTSDESSLSRTAESHTSTSTSKYSQPQW